MALFAALVLTSRKFRSLDCPHDVVSSPVWGMDRMFSATGETHVLLSFGVKGGWRQFESSVATSVLQYLMGGGGSFSAGGPGAVCSRVRVLGFVRVWKSSALCQEERYALTLKQATH